MPKLSPRPESNSSHLAGEYFVAAELYKRGFSVALTIGNAKAIDLFAEKDKCTVNVQVKAIRRRGNVGWPMSRARVMDGIVYVFVCLNGDDDTPTYFIASAREVRPRVKEYRTRGILNYGAVNTPQFKGRWDKLTHSLRRPGERHSV